MPTSVLVVGGGVAGCELAWGLARRAVPTILLTTSLDTLYALPADTWPALPPPASLWARIAQEALDAEGRQRAGPLRRAAKRELEREPALRVLQSNAVAIARTDDGRVLGVHTWEGPLVEAAHTVLAVGSFLGARLTLGRATERAGRLSEMAYDDLRDDLRAAGVGLRRCHLTSPGDAVTPAYRVEHDAVAPDEVDAVELDGRAVTGAGRARRWSGLWWLGAVLGPLDLEAAAAAGRDLAELLAADPGPG